MPHRVFISHATAQGALASDLCDILEVDGKVRCWLAPRDIPLGGDWVEAIPAAVRAADLVVVLLSPEANQSMWVDRELSGAVSSGRPLLPVFLGEFSLSERSTFLLDTTQRTTLPLRPSEAQLRRLAGQVKSVLGDEQRSRDLVSPAEPEQAPRVPDPFLTERVSSAHPAYFVVLLDHSWSMNRFIPHTKIRARDAVANVVNEMLYKLLQTSLKDDGYQHYFDVSILGYGLGATRKEVSSRLPTGEQRVAVPDLDERWLRLEETEMVEERPDGRLAKVINTQPVWVESVPCRGRTVMAEAFKHAGDLVSSWITTHERSLPPVVMNVTDGGWTGEDPLAAVRELQEQATALGPTLVFNCQLDTSEPAPQDQLLYPSEVPESYGRRTRELFWLSSVLPASMREEARARGFAVDDEARGLLYNAPVARVVDFLQVGTQTLV